MSEHDKQSPEAGSANDTPPPPPPPETSAPSSTSAASKPENGSSESASPTGGAASDASGGAAADANAGPASSGDAASASSGDAASASSGDAASASGGDATSAAPADASAAGGRGPDGKARKRKRKRKKKSAEPRAGGAPTQVKPAARGTPSTPADRIRVAFAELASAYLDLRRRAGGQRLPKSDRAEVELTLKVPLKNDELPKAAEQFTNELRSSLEQRVLDAGLLVPGRVWCFQTESFDSDYSRPEDPRQVLVGYGLEGRPRYADLVTLAIERKHDAVEELLAGREGAVSFVEAGEAVTEGVKPAFDPHTIPYQLVGQLVAGLFESSEAGRRVALTVQVLANEGEDNKLHLVSHPVSAVDLLDLPDPSIPRILRGFQNKLVECAKEVDGKRAAGETPNLAEAVEPLLKDLSKRLSSNAKTKERKTTHARERENERPTTLAFPEARSARDHHLYVDGQENTVVVVGKKGRIHVFSPDGRHVTSVVMSPTNVKQRVKQGRWRQAEPTERGSFRDAIAQHGASDPAQT